MEVFKFRISGSGAIFTNPCVNSISTSYPHIHKIALLGLLGAVIGIEKNNENKFICYDTLKDLKIAIVPSKISFDRAIVNKTDTSGCSNYDSLKDITGSTIKIFNKANIKEIKSGKNFGTTYISNYTELISPSWDIYIQDNSSDVYNKIKQSIINKESYYIPYLGKNWRMASFDEVEVLLGHTPDIIDSITGIFPKKDFNFDIEDDFDNFEEINTEYIEFFAPIGLNKTLGVYDEEELAITNKNVEYLGDREKVINVKGNNLYFF